MIQVQKLRLQRGWSQQQLAELSGVSVRTIQRIEGGQAAGPETLKSLASVFEIDFTQLATQMNSEPDMTTASSISPSDAPAIDPDEQLALKHVRKVKGFYLHLIQYVVVNAVLAIINIVTKPHYLWFLWAALGWGIGLMSHAMQTFEWAPFFGAKWEKNRSKAAWATALKITTHSSNPASANCQQCGH